MNCCSFGLYESACPEPDICGVVTPTFVTAPVTAGSVPEAAPEALGGEILRGNYVLQEKRYYEIAPGDCALMELNETPFGYTLMLRASSGTISIPDAQYSASFDYYATDAQIALTPTCQNGVLDEHLLWDFDSYSTTQAGLEFVDSWCGAVLTFRRIGQ